VAIGGDRGVSRRRVEDRSIRASSKSPKGYAEKVTFGAKARAARRFLHFIQTLDLESRGRFRESAFSCDVLRACRDGRTSLKDLVFESIFF